MDACDIPKTKQKYGQDNIFVRQTIDTNQTSAEDTGVYQSETVLLDTMVTQEITVSLVTLRKLTEK